MTHSSLKISLKSDLDPKFRYFVCYGQIYLYYTFDVNDNINENKTVLYIQGTLERYIKNRLFRWCVDSFVKKALKLH